MNEINEMGMTPPSPSGIHYYSPRLEKKLAGLITAPVTIVEAPSGYGKTTAVKDYLRGQLPATTSVFWWNADEDAPETSWARLCKIFARIDPRSGEKLYSNAFPCITNAWEIAETIADIECSVPSVLVLDDFQHLQKHLPRSVMSAILSYAGANLILVIITQTTRPFLRSFFQQAGANYLHINDLRLQADDIYRYYQLCGLAISKSEAKQLYRYTEGWIIALYLIILQIQQGEGFTPGLGIIRLIESIVWENADFQTKNLLLHLALFSSITAEQIGFLFQSKCPQGNVLNILDEIPFVRYETSKQCYIFHAILRKMLLRRLEAADSETRTSCYSRAGTWYAHIGDSQRALSCFFKAKDFESILSQPLTKLTMVRIDENPFTQLMAKMLSECPADIQKKYPISLLRIAYAYIGAGEIERADKLMAEIKAIINDIADETERKSLLGEWILISAYREFPDIVKMEQIMKQAVGLIGGQCRTIANDEPFAFGLPLMIFFAKKPGGLQDELQALRRVAHHLTILTGIYGGIDILLEAECAIYRGELDKAEPLCHQALYLAGGANQWPIRAGAVNQLAQIAFKRCSNEELTRYIRALEESVGQDAMSPWVSQMLQADYYSWGGLTQLTAEWIAAGDIPFPDAPCWVKTYLRYAHLVVLLQKEDYTRFLGAAEAALSECKNRGYLVMQIYTRLLAAVGYLRTGREEKALDHVLKALTDALPDRIYLPLMELKGILGDLVERAFSFLGIEMPVEVITEGGIIDSNWKLLVRYATESNTLPYELTGREMEVATLAAKGMRNREIAKTLFISEATVRFHLRSVFSKLGIDRRGKLPGLLEKGMQ